MSDQEKAIEPLSPATGSEALSFDDEVRVMKHLLAQIGTDEAAAFVVRLQRCVDGQLCNIEAYQREFRRLLENNAPSNTKLRHGSKKGKCE